jgi:hypothetical protein
MGDSLPRWWPVVAVLSGAMALLVSIPAIG